MSEQQRALLEHIAGRRRMENVAVIFAGGVGQRMRSDAVPKQFLELNGKPILVYTIEKFQRHPQIDGIVVVCLAGWLERCRALVEQYGLTKVSAVVPGGSSGHMSRLLGLEKAAQMYRDAIVLLHDGVRPLIDADTISRCIESVRACGSAVVASPAVETIAMEREGNVRIVNREHCQMLRAPQCFFLDEILRLYRRSREDGYEDLIDSAVIMQMYGKPIRILTGPPENIKITTPLDYYVFKGIMEARDARS